jgi:LPS export ABC transporter permease LptG/LPS export ABC transporter permease LptF
MRIITKYILREMTSYALIGAGVFTFLFFMVNLERLLELVVRNSAPLPSVLEIFAYTLPQTLTITVPMGVLVGILIGFSRLAADSEITAMRSTGMGAWEFVRISSLFILVACALAIANNVFLVSRAAAARTALDDRLKSSQVSYEVQPRVFYEDFANYVLYVQDATSAKGAARWKKVFLADVSTPSSPKLTLAQEGVVIGEGTGRLHLQLLTGAQHENVPTDPDQYSITGFGETDIFLPLATSAQGTRANAPATEMDTSRLRHAATLQKEPSDAAAYLIEFHRRWTMAIACIVLALVGVPLGLSAKKGGKSTGFVLTIALVFIYYLVALSGMSLARQGKTPAWMGMWLSDTLFFIAGLIMLYRVDRFPIHFPAASHFLLTVRQRFVILGKHLRHRVSPIANSRAVRTRGRFRVVGFPMLVDELILWDFVLYLAMILFTFLVLTLVFTFFELLRDIVKNHVAISLVAKYLVNLIPFLVYNMLPVTVLLTVLVTFGLMQKANEITAMKASGISIYRITVPVLVMSAMLAAGLFGFDQWYLPQANKRQDALRNQIKGKAPQTYLRPERKWIFGEHSTIYYYAFFDPDQNRFANLQAFEFNPQTFEITRRVYGARARWSDSLNRWVFEQGWERSFRGSAIENYRTFDVATFPELSEPPPYFKKEVKQSSEMNYAELGNYIRELQQGGFDVVRLRVQLQKKLAFPMIALVMAMLAVPFALRTGRRGALAGVATAIAIGVIYLILSGLFEAMGNTNELPAFIAAWSPDVMFALAAGYFILKVPT